MIPIAAADARAAAPPVDVLRSGSLPQGPAVARLEAGFAELTGTQHAVAVPSGTAALGAALLALGIGPGDEVVTSPFTAAATLSAILTAGATARFADVSATDYCLDPAAAAAAIGPRTTALLPAHLYGQPADVGQLALLSAGYGLALVEDAAQALGASCDGRPVGAAGVGCFSLRAGGDQGVGGVVTTSDDSLARRLRRDHRPHGPVGAPPLACLAERIRARTRNAERLTEGLAGLPGLVRPTALPGRGHVWRHYTVRVTEQARLSRDELSERLAELGVASRARYPLLAFDRVRDHPLAPATDVPVAAALTREVLSLPVHAALSDADVTAIVDAVALALAA